MIQHMYSIRDKKDGYAAIVPFISEISSADELAKRYFESHLKRTPIMNDNMEDFEICEIGTFDTISGTFLADPNIHPKTIAKGADYIGNKNFTI